MTQDDTGSAPMLGSQPVAWAVMVRWEYRDICDSYEEAKRRADAITYWDGDDLVTAGVTPLYRNRVALTEAEKDAVQGAVAYWQPIHPYDKSAIATLRCLLERLG